MQSAINKIIKNRDDELHYADAKHRLHCYLRVSTKGQVEEGHSIENQRHLGRKVADKLGLKYVEMNEGGKSSSIGTRPVFEELKTGIRNGQIKHLWYFSRSRWSRDEIEDGLIRLHYFRKYNINVYEGETGNKRRFDSSQDRFLDSIFTSVQQLDREQRREVSVSGKRHLSRQNGETGVFMGGTINFGYANVDKKWTIDKDEAKYVKKIFSLYLQDKSLQDIKSYLDSQGVKPRRSKLWNIGTLLTMLKNRVYLGEYKWIDKESGEEFDIRFDAIISHSMFNRVRKKLDKNTRNTGNNSRQYTSLLSDLLKCSCGENITGNVRKTVNRKVYECSSKRNHWKGKEVEICINRRSMNMDLTDEFVVSKVKEVMTNSSILKDRFKEDVMSKKGIDSSQIELEKKMREKSIKSLDKQIELTVVSISTNEVNHMLKKTEDAIYKQVKIALDEEKGNLEDKKSSLVEEIYELDNRKDWIDWITKYGEDISKRFEKPTTELLEGMIDTVVVSPTFALNRDEIEKQVGHKLVVNFKQPIVDDSIKYEDENNKSKGYNVVNGNKELDVGNLAILKGGRGKSAKKKHRN